MHIVCLTVSNRPHWAPWLCLAWEALCTPLRTANPRFTAELVLVAVGWPPERLLALLEECGKAGAGAPIRAIAASPELPLWELRNLALAEFRRRAVGASEGPSSVWGAWVDDDDLQSPQRLQGAFLAQHAGLVAVGCDRSWFLCIPTLQAQPYLPAPPPSPRKALFNSLVFRGDLVTSSTGEPLKGALFPARAKAADTPWTYELHKRAGAQLLIVSRPTFAWACHDLNLSNPLKKRKMFRSHFSRVIQDMQLSEPYSARLIITARDLDLKDQSGPKSDV